MENKKSCKGCVVRKKHGDNRYCAFGFKVEWDPKARQLYHQADCPHPKTIEEGKAYVAERMRGKQ